MKKIIHYLLENPVRNLIIIGILFRAMLYLFVYSSYTRTLDSDGYIELSQLLYPLNLSGYNGLRTIGYPIFITMLNQNLYLVALFQFLLGIATSILWYKTLLRYKFSVKSSFLITVFLLSFISNVFYETCILVETLALFLISILFYMLSLFTLDDLNMKQILALAFIMMYLVLVKPFYAFLPFLILAFLFIKKPALRTILSKSLIIIALPLLGYFGCCTLNKINIGYFVPTSYTGLTRAQNCVYFAEKTPEKYQWIGIPYAQYREISIAQNIDPSMAIWDAMSNGAYDKYNLTFEQFSEELGNYANATIVENPKEYAIQVITRSWVDFWKTTALWDKEKFNSPEMHTLIDEFWKVQHLLLRILKLVFLVLTPYYLFQCIKTRKLTNEFVISVVVLATSILQAMATYGTNSRYSFPFEFIMIIMVFMFIKERIIYSNNSDTASLS